MIIDTVITIQEHRLQSMLAEGLRQAQRNGHPVLVSMVLRAPETDPLAYFDRGGRVAHERLYWSAPGGECVLAGVGAAWTQAAEGANRFADSSAAWRELCADALIEDPFGTLGTGPILMGGFSFDPLRPSTELWEGYPDGLLILPRFLLTQANGATLLTLNTVLHPDSSLAAATAAALRVYDLFDGEPLELGPAPAGQIRSAEDVPAAAEWQAIVRRVEQALRRGDLGKVVLARQYRVQGRALFNPAHVVGRLGEG
jgi:isochorismate synthase EntC